MPDRRSRIALAARLGLAIASISSSAGAQAVPAAPTSIEDDYARHMDNGVRLYRTGDYATALVELEAAYRVKPGPSPLIDIALCHRELRDYPAAIRALERALADHRAAMTPPDRTASEETLRDLRSLLAHLRLEVDPPEAVVSVDGRDLPAETGRSRIPLGPGTHRIAARANGRVPHEERIDVVSGEERALAYVLRFATGRVRITTRAPRTPIEIDGEIVGHGDWNGELRAGRHEVRLVGEGTSMSIDVAPGEALDVRGDGAKAGVRPLPVAPPAPPPPVARVDPEPRGPYVFAAGSLLVPTDGPAAPGGGSNGLAAAMALHGGYRVQTFAAFEVVALAGAASGESDAEASSWSKTSFRGGVAMRLSTTGRTVRLVGALSAGLAWDRLETLRGGIQRGASGFDPFGMADVGLEVEAGHVLFGAAIEAWLDGVAGVTFDDGSGAYDAAIVPAVGPSVRAGYCFW